MIPTQVGWRRKVATRSPDPDWNMDR